MSRYELWRHRLPTARRRRSTPCAIRAGRPCACCTSRSPQRLDVWCAEHGIGEAIVGRVLPARPVPRAGRGAGSTAVRPPRAGGGAVRAACARACSADGDGVRLDRARRAGRSRRGDLVQAGPLLVSGGALAFHAGDDREGFSAGAGQFDSDITDGRHPRAALGRRRRATMIAVACDGRRSGVDAGLSMPELAAVMLELGADDAINLDGGGSTTLVHRGHLLNRPYSTQDQPAPESRPVVTALAFELMRARASWLAAAGRARADRRRARAGLRPRGRVFDADGFAARVDASLRTDAVSADVARRLSDAAIARGRTWSPCARWSSRRRRASCAARRSARSSAARRATSTAPRSTATPARSR